MSCSKGCRQAFSPRVTVSEKLFWNMSVHPISSCTSFDQLFLFLGQAMASDEGQCFTAARTPGELPWQAPLGCGSDDHGQHRSLCIHLAVFHVVYLQKRSGTIRYSSTTMWFVFCISDTIWGHKKMGPATSHMVPQVISRATSANLGVDVTYRSWTGHHPEIWPRNWCGVYTSNRIPSSSENCFSVIFLAWMFWDSFWRE